MIKTIRTTRTAVIFSVIVIQIYLFLLLCIRFLIDRVGNVLIVGSPLRSEKIRNLMFQMLDGKE